MSNWRDEEERYQDELDEEREQNRRALSDDFAAFDASRYVRDVRGRAASSLSQPQPDAEPEERDPTADWDDPLARLPSGVRRVSSATGTSRRRSRRAAQRSVRSASSTSAARSTRTDRAERDPSLLGALFGSGLAPGLRFIVLGYGCFGVMLLIGLCGIFAWLLGIR
ncbi:MAG: hypothetical protein CUN51_01040 [Candidatus Thermofonsia Clade 1 bacterium]|uniref:Uncharacterized protein n=1 Tax=Candidatus Thermofonsia Clade 1 bacterium TaxID=2364210 RepID=A0A2M8P3X2_9CHLR|nr:MAG: hypothetical protein CUN51_01040 [Candidatus Thermofonsia Clade 1 bacterium]